MNNLNNSQINNTFSYDNSEEQLQVGIKIILNAFENKIKFFEKESGLLNENVKEKDLKISELQSLLENISEDLKKCQEFNSNLIKENRYLQEVNERLSEDNSKLIKFRNSILTSLHVDSNFILNTNNEFERNKTGQNFNGKNLNYDNNLFRENTQYNEYNKTLIQNYDTKGNENNNNNQNYFDENENNNNDINNYQRQDNSSPFNRYDISPKNYNLANESKEKSIENKKINQMISNLHKKLKSNECINELIKNENEQKLKTKTFTNSDSNKKTNYEDYNNNNNNKFTYENDLHINSNNLDQKILNLKNKIALKKSENYNNEENLASINSSNTQSQFYPKREKFESSNNLKDKSNKYKNSSKFFNEARFILKKEDFDELVFLIKSRNQNKITAEEFDSRINLLIGNFPVLINDLSSVLV
jgi:hypothetical protein